jgi:hypothetical protein
MQKTKPHKNLASPKGHTFPALPSSMTNTEARPPTEALPTPRVTEQKKQPAKPHTKLGWRFLLNGQTQAAMSAYRQAIRHNPQSANAYLGLGMTLKSIGKVGMAKKAFLTFRTGSLRLSLCRGAFRSTSNPNRPQIVPSGL